MAAKLLKKEYVYPKDANAPTKRLEYECPCGRGKIIEESVSGFDDLTVWIECGACRENYMIRTGYGSRWETVKK